ncbi:hypothetical protein MJ561_15930 [Klebsiella pneumoniae]|nr:hypothetical protein MJ561_15930 [Klebsiella pneumoniae]
MNTSDITRLSPLSAAVDPARGGDWRNQGCPFVASRRSPSAIANEMMWCWSRCSMIPPANCLSRSSA